jgi:hypothetical protein
VALAEPGVGLAVAPGVNREVSAGVFGVTQEGRAGIAVGETEKASPVAVAAIPPLELVALVREHPELPDDVDQGRSSIASPTRARAAWSTRA